MWGPYLWLKDYLICGLEDFQLSFPTGNSLTVRVIKIDLSQVVLYWTVFATCLRSVGPSGKQALWTRQLWVATYTGRAVVAYRTASIPF
jgi:hypothetical protein